MKRVYEGSRLHCDGYVIHSQALSLDPSLIEQIQKYGQSETRAISNHNEEYRDDKLHQCPLPWEFLYESILKSVSLFPELVNLDFLNWVILHSLPGCQEQDPHCDYPPSWQLGLTMESLVPCGIMVALMPKTTLSVWPYSSSLITLDPALIKASPSPIMPYEKKVVSLSPGDVLIFRGDLVHAESAYSEDNFRLYGFADSPAVPRLPNHRTWVIGKHASPEIQGMIEF